MAGLSQKIDLDNNNRNRNVWFMSDLHYNHVNILKIGKGRSFSDISEMNQYILGELRSKVKKNDILFDLGDLIWKEKPSDIKSFAELLPERSYKVLGNHDSHNIKAWGGTWKMISDLLDIIIKKDGEDIQFALSHYPMLDWNHRFRGSINLHGHCHGNIDSINKESGELRLDIGFDSEIAEESGSFLIHIDTILKWAKGLTSGKKFREFAYDKNNRGWK